MRQFIKIYVTSIILCICFVNHWYITNIFVKWPLLVFIFKLRFGVKHSVSIQLYPGVKVCFASFILACCPLYNQIQKKKKKKKKKKQKKKKKYKKKVGGTMLSCFVPKHALWYVVLQHFNLFIFSILYNLAFSMACRVVFKLLSISSKTVHVFSGNCFSLSIQFSLFIIVINVCVYWHFITAILYMPYLYQFKPLCKTSMLNISKI